LNPSLDFQILNLYLVCQGFIKCQGLLCIRERFCHWEIVLWNSQNGETKNFAIYIYNYWQSRDARLCRASWISIKLDINFLKIEAPFLITYFLTKFLGSYRLWRQKTKVCNTNQFSKTLQLSKKTKNKSVQYLSNFSQTPWLFKIKNKSVQYLPLFSKTSQLFKRTRVCHTKTKNLKGVSLTQRDGVIQSLIRLVIARLRFPTSCLQYIL